MLADSGKAISAVARELGVHPNTVHAVLGGRPGTKGDAHKVAVALGVRHGTLAPVRYLTSSNELESTGHEDCGLEVSQ